MSDTIDKVSVIISRGSLEGVYPGLIMANGARMEGIDANVFFTFFGLDAINRAKHDHVKVATVGEPGLAPRHLAGRIPRHVHRWSPTSWPARWRSSTSRPSPSSWR